MKKEDAVKRIRDKRTVLAIAVLLLIVAIILCVAAVRQNVGKKAPGMAELMTESLKESGFSYLPGGEYELEKAAEATAELLDELVVTGADRQEMIQRVQEYLTGLDWGLTDEQTAELAEWLVDIYLENYETVYGEPSGIYQSVSRLEETLLEQMRTDLESISEYLTTLDASVTNNKEELLQLTEKQEGDREAVLNYLESLRTVVSGLRTELTEYRNSQSEEQLFSEQEFAEMKNRMDSLTQAILDLETGMKESIEYADGNNGGRYEALEEELDDLSSELKNKTEDLMKRLSELLSELKRSENETHADLSERISRSQTELQRTMDKLEESEKARHETAEAGNVERYELTNQNINGKVASLSVQLNGVHADISAAQEAIAQLLADMKKDDNLRMQEILEKFTGINEALVAINTNMDTAHGELKALIETVRTEAGENQEELLGVLNEIDHSFTEQNNQNFEALVQSLHSQTDEMKAQLEQLRSSFDQNYQILSESVNSVSRGVNESKTEMLEKLVEMENNLSQDVTNITAGVSGSQAELLQKLTDMEGSVNARLTGLSGDIQSVFQRVSNGKKLLASALLTKNVVVDEDAAFQEIHDGILKINQKIVIGVDQIPGTVKYEYHHHTGSADSGGGCYTVENVHHHNSDCYQVCEYSWTGCAGDGWTDGNHISHCPYRETHTICYEGKPVEKIYDHSNYGGSQSGHRAAGSSAHVVLVCGKEEGGRYGWSTGCGLQEGQIIGAQITYDAAAVSAAAAEYREENSQNGISGADLERLLKAAQTAPVIPEGNQDTEKLKGNAEEEKETENETETDMMEKPESKKDPEDETESEEQPEAPPEPESETETKEEPEAPQEPEGETESEERPEIPPEPESETETKEEPEAPPEPEGETESEERPEIPPEPEGETESEERQEIPQEPESETETKEEPEASPEPESETESEERPEAPPEPESETEAEEQAAEIQKETADTSEPPSLSEKTQETAGELPQEPRPDA